MASAKDVLVYFLKNHPKPDDLSKARVTKLAYLADWRSAITRGCQITNFQWYFNNYGPYIDDLTQLARSDSDFELVASENVYGHPKHIIKLVNCAAESTLTADERAVLDFVVQTSTNKTWQEFIKLVYSTYPIRTQPRHSHLNLIELAVSYKEERGQVKQLQAVV